MIKKEQAIIVRSYSFELTAEQLNVDGGIKVLVDKLGVVFKSENIDEAYDAYSKSISFRKSEDMPMMDYILEFKHLNRKMAEHEMHEMLF